MLGEKFGKSLTFPVKRSFDYFSVQVNFVHLFVAESKFNWSASESNFSARCLLSVQLNIIKSRLWNLTNVVAHFLSQ